MSTTPNSPSVCAKLRTTAVTMPGRESGKMTRESSQAAGAENGGGVEQAAVDCFKGDDQRLHGERESCTARKREPIQ